MTNKIEILSPGPGCHRTQRIIHSIKNLLQNHRVEYELEIITNQALFTNYRTWILPTVVINNKIVSRGYKPLTKIVLESLIQ